MRSAPPKAAVERFLSDLDRVTGGQTHVQFGLCVSGGPDSVALLLLARDAGLACQAATVDHGLRPEAKDEAQFVAKLCQELDIFHKIITIETKPVGNVSAWARKARYAALADWSAEAGIDRLLTAHHADDQLETMIMRLNRGSGVAGLSAIREQSDQVARPLLRWRKTELEGLVDECGITPCLDPSNKDDSYDRARLRKALVSATWLDPIAAAKSAEALAEAEIALQWATRQQMEHCISTLNDSIYIDPYSLPKELLRRITISCLHRLNPVAEPRGEGLDRLLKTLSEGQTATLSGVKCVGGEIWRFSKAPPRRTV